MTRKTDECVEHVRSSVRSADRTNPRTYWSRIYWFEQDISGSQWCLLDQDPEKGVCLLQWIGYYIIYAARNIYLSINHKHIWGRSHGQIAYALLHPTKIHMLKLNRHRQNRLFGFGDKAFLEVTEVPRGHKRGPWYDSLLSPPCEDTGEGTHLQLTEEPQNGIHLAGPWSCSFQPSEYMR